MQSSVYDNSNFNFGSADELIQLLSTCPIHSNTSANTDEVTYPEGKHLLQSAS